MGPLQAKALASQDQAWTDIAEWTEQLEAILDRGPENLSDVVAIKKSIMLVLAEVTYRKAEHEDH